ncbi:RICIN domain-containing protein [Streptomyces filamentosus]|uniref:RICIN domain-containing protein n=1 Tax=Streptomyces filamentosus TaxID=67294 RepID=UPI00340D010F
MSCKGNRAYTWRVQGTNGWAYLNVSGGSRKGAKVITWPWAGGRGNEKWCLTTGPNGYGYNFRPWDRKDLCLDVPDARYNRGQGLIVWNCNNRKNQLFQTVIRREGSLQYTIIGPWYAGSMKMHRGAREGAQVSLWPHLNMNAAWQ